MDRKCKQDMKSSFLEFSYERKEGNKKEVRRGSRTSLYLQRRKKKVSDFCAINHSNVFLDISPEARETETTINYWGVPEWLSPLSGLAQALISGW